VKNGVYICGKYIFVLVEIKALQVASKVLFELSLKNKTSENKRHFDAQTHDYHVDNHAFFVILYSVF
jgi:hypothetical protein